MDIININIYDVSNGFQVVEDNRVLGVAETFKGITDIIDEWCDFNGISLDEVKITGDLYLSTESYY